MVIFTGDTEINSWSRWCQEPRTPVVMANTADRGHFQQHEIINHQQILIQFWSSLSPRRHHRMLEPSWVHLPHGIVSLCNWINYSVSLLFLLHSPASLSPFQLSELRKATCVCITSIPFISPINHRDWSTLKEPFCDSHRVCTSTRCSWGWCRMWIWCESINKLQEKL